MKLVWCSLLLQTFHFFVYTKDAHHTTSSASLASKFNYDITHPPSVGEVIIWPMSEDTETFKPQIYYQTNIPKLESNKTYLIFTQSQLNQFCFYYWIGSKTSLTTKKSAARYALLQYLQFKEQEGDEENTSITREEEFVESESFHNMVNYVNKSDVEEDVSGYYVYVDKHFPSKMPNLYIVRGQHSIRYKAVPIGTKWFISDACLILETGLKVEELHPHSVYCGPNANNYTRIKALYLAWHFLFFHYNKDVQPTLKECDPMFKAFVEVLENLQNYRMHEEDDSNDHLKDPDTFVADYNRSVSLYKMYQTMTVRMCLNTNEISLEKYYKHDIFDTYGTHLFDSASIAGIFLHIHTKADIEEKLWGLEKAEEYLHYKYSLASKPKRMRINEIYALYSLLHMDFKMNLGNES